MSENIEKRYFKGREIFIPERHNEFKEGVRKDLEKEKKHTQEIKGKYQKELGDLTKRAKNFAFEEILVSERNGDPYVFSLFPHIVVIPDRYPLNYGLIQGFVPKNRLEEGIEMLFFHERLHSAAEIARDANGTRREIEVNRKMMKETPNLDAIASLALIQPMLSKGVDGARTVRDFIQELQKREPSSDRPFEEIFEQFSQKFPHAHRKTLEKLTKRYIEIGGEILENFDNWEKENVKKTKN